ncbi:MAG: hypothetical protein GX621_08495 [Pirellulaceae bacterium]|nr:hypothetical protein [Pirellulaceae bacterium]
MSETRFKNVFILSSGRCGSRTIARAFAHATNYTAGHETRVKRYLANGRLDYPNAHIESDPRLAFYLGPLDEQYGNNAAYIHLTRDETATIRSHANRTHLPLMRW